eukprot:scaffold1958_cov253-Pinguiococcus_pyrenoidosus.AAC.6
MAAGEEQIRQCLRCFAPKFTPSDLPRQQGVTIIDQYYYHSTTPCFGLEQERFHPRSFPAFAFLQVAKTVLLRVATPVPPLGLRSARSPPEAVAEVQRHCRVARGTREALGASLGRR